MTDPFTPGCRSHPRNASPVPHLTSLYHFERAGECGDRSYPGNCGGNLIRDLLVYFKPQGICLDPMSGSGTCRDVCDELGIPCMSWDIHHGVDARDPQGFSPNETFAFIWAHPPYWRQKVYADIWNANGRFNRRQLQPGGIWPFESL
ncbi:MAG TPA: hypothetical protein VGP76_32005 [Planctomycetaceae bacterium]|nr:hypothetical protein [Planctomycetaceae bacterium]